MPHHLNLSQDGQRDFSRLASTQVEADGGVDASKLAFIHAVSLQMFKDNPTLAAAADHTNVRRRGGERGAQDGLVADGILGHDDNISISSDDSGIKGLAALGAYICQTDFVLP